MLTFLAINVIEEVDAVFHDAVTHVAVVTTCIAYISENVSLNNFQPQSQLDQSMQTAAIGD